MKKYYRIGLLILGIICPAILIGLAINDHLYKSGHINGQWTITFCIWMLLHMLGAVTQFSLKDQLEPLLPLFKIKEGNRFMLGELLREKLRKEGIDDQPYTNEEVIQKLKEVFDKKSC